MSGLFGSREAQGGRALWQLANVGGKARNGCLDPAPPEGSSFVHIYVHPQYTYSKSKKLCEMQNLSMSWWLSKPVQAYLDNEVINANLIPILDVLRRPQTDAPGEQLPAVPH